MWTETPRRVDGVVHEYDSAIVGDRMQITVVEPYPGAAASGARFPAIYVLDALATFDIVLGAKRLFDMFSGGALPLAYFIGLGYADMDIEPRRFRDFTPTDAAMPPGITGASSLGLGGASRYLEALRREIIPHLEATYPLDGSERALLGYSLSGLFAAHVVFESPETFSRYLVISPSLWWDQASILADEEAWGRAHDDLPAKVCVVAGAEEEQPGGGWRNNLPDDIVLPLKLVSNIRELDRRLVSRSYPGLRLKTMLIPDGRHISVFPGAVGAGLIEVFGL